MKQFATLFLMIGFFVLMLCFPRETFEGASNGLLLWFQIILPTLLPFIILSNLLIHTNAVTYISNIIKPFTQRLFRVSDYGCYAVFVGFLCGYPMGAKVIADLIQTGRISQNEGQYLLSFCNNTSPMFIISFIVMQNFKNESLLLGTLIILYFAPVLCSFIFRKYYQIRKHSFFNLKHQTEGFCFRFNLFDECIMNGFETITKVGGYIILFSILFSLCKKLPLTWFLPSLEISCGISYIVGFDIPLACIFPYVLSLTSFGGFCAIAQTNSMIQDSNLSIIPYIIQKIITALVTFLLATLYINLIF